MRDLYRRIGVSVGSTIAEIEEALHMIEDARLKRDIECVLLHPYRRKVYDHLYSTLSKIGTLRVRMGLTHTSGWKYMADDDFVTDGANISSAHEIFLEKVRLLGHHARKRKIMRVFLFPLLIPWYLVRAFPPLLIIGLLIGIGWLVDVFDQNSDDSNYPTSYRRPSTSYVSSSFNEPALPLPSNGHVQMLVSRACVAPFEIKSSGRGHYLVKLQDAYSGVDILTVFVQGGRTVNIDVPIGTYVIKYACGNTWYGYQHLFGPQTICSKADERFTFEQIGLQVSGYTITLYAVPGGNLSTSLIDRSDF